MEPKERSKPEVLLNLSRLKRKETSTYKTSDMWTQDDDLLFLKYCPSQRVGVFMLFHEILLANLQKF